MTRNKKDTTEIATTITLQRNPLNEKQYYRTSFPLEVLKALGLTFGEKKQKLVWDIKPNQVIVRKFEN
jgi:hypothetical protein